MNNKILKNIFDNLESSLKNEMKIRVEHNLEDGKSWTYVKFLNTIFCHLFYFSYKLYLIINKLFQKKKNNSIYPS